MILVASIFISFAFAADKPVCSAKAITRNCEFFTENKDKEFIELPDGTRYRNPVGKYTPQTEALKSSPKEKLEEYGVKSLKNQAQILELLDGKGMTSEFRLVFSNVAISAELNSSKTMRVPWPPEKKNAETKDVPAEDVQKYLKNKLGKKYSDLQNAISSRASALKEEMDTTLKEMKLTYLEQEKSVNITPQIQKREKRVMELFNQAKDSVVEVVTRGKPESQWTDVEKAMVAKVKEIRLNTQQESALDSTCKSDPNNANYYKNGTINICSQRFMSPDAGLLMVMAHELGHAIDPCHFQMPKVTIDRKKLTEYASSANNLGPQGQQGIVRLLLTGGDVLYDDPDLWMDPKLSAQLKEKGIIQVSGGFAFEKYPFAKEYSCLEKKGFRDNSAKDIEGAVNFLKKSAQLSANPAAAQNIVDQYEKTLKKYPQCLRSASHMSEMGEVCSDMIGAVAFEKYISENKIESEAEKIGSLPFPAMECEFGYQGMPDELSAEFISTYGFANTNQQHPNNSAREKHILFSLPKVAEAFGCTRAPNSCFDHLSLLNRSSSKPSRSSDTTNSRGDR